ncbi:MAG: DUF502 domain-containing protein [Acidobacteriota bacterium]
MSRLIPQIRVRVLAGLVFLLPLGVCLWLADILFRLVDRLVTNQIRPWLGFEGLPGLGALWASRLVALVVLLLVLYLIGTLAANVFGKRLLEAGVQAVERIPVVGGIYRGTRQLFDALGPGGRSAFRRCVLLEYPRRGLWTIAFVSNERRQLLGDPPVPCLGVYVPTAINPTAGFFLMVPEHDTRPLAITVEEGLKIVVSGGIVMPATALLPLDSDFRATESM